MEGPRGESVVEPGDAGKRLDVFMSSRTGLSRNRAQRLIASGAVLLDGEPARKNLVLAEGRKVSWEIPPVEPEEVTPQDIPLDVVYEDASVAVIDKPAGMVMYPGPGHPSDTMLNALLARYPEIEGVGGKGRPGIFHRLDRNTSGLVAVARTEEAYQSMVRMMKRREVERRYLALVSGDIPAEQGTIDAPMGRSDRSRKKMAVRQYGGREAVSRFRVRERFKQGYNLVEVTLETGRTHQIRVHFSYMGYPVAGDPEYFRGRGRRELGLDRQFLHAFHLAFPHPISGDEMAFNSELPEDLVDVLDRLRSGV